MTSGIYKITHVASGKFYIGSAVNVEKRVTNHKHELRKGVHHNKRLQNAWLKYGADAFVFSTLLICSKENLLMYEQSSNNIVAYNSVTHSGDGLFLWSGQSTMDSGQGG